ncbi:MAG: c-type cytochrome [Chryseolinea sp.]
MPSVITSRIALHIIFVLITSCTFEQEKQPTDNALLGLGFGIGNAAIFVQDLDSSRNYYADVLGFEMPPPNKFQKGMYDSTRSALVYFPDMSSFDLVALKDTTAVLKHSFIKYFLQHHEGVRVYSLSTSSAGKTRDWLSAKEFKMDSIQTGRTTAELPKGWDWDDGGPEWRSADFNFDNPPAHLPNFIEYIGFPYKEMQAEWTSLHTSWRQYYNHPNGVVGMVALRIAVSNLDDAREEFKRMGLTELEVNESKTLARFKIAYHQELHLMAPESANDKLSNFLETRGPGVFAVRFEVKKLKDTRDFLRKKLPAKALLVGRSPARLIVLKEYARGVQLEFVEESKAQGDLAKIYNFKKDSKLDTAALQYASALYTKYCALCHGNNREGYAADFAPSLRSRSLMATTHSSNYLRHAVFYGRQGTAMAGYAKNQGGPLEEVEIDLLLQWLYELSGVKKPIDISTESITGNVALGKTLYAKNCTTCHGENGEGVSAPALRNPMLLATASDAFLRYAISEGRDSTSMPAFKDSLTNVEMDALTAYLRSRASGWNAPETVTVTEPLPQNYVLNPYSKAPKFTLHEGLYVSSEQLLKALKDSSRIVMLDARSKAAWHQAHIPGAISVPYYEEPDTFIKDIPNDSTWIVAYCACPHAASQRVVNTLKRFGFKKTAILDEGVLVWTQRGYPIQYGQDNKKKKKKEDSKKKK